MQRGLRCGTWFFGITFFATGALAQGAEPSDAEARARFSAGEIAYAAARYDEALEDFQRAYELSERPELLYNVGLSAERLRRDDVAIDAFERFLELSPDHENADQARTRLALLRQVSTSPPDETPDDPDEIPPDESVGAPSRAGPWVLGIAGGVLVVGGAVLLAVALSDKSEIEGLMEPTPWPQLEDQVASVPRLSGAGIALIAAGGAATIGAVLWRVMTPDESTVDVSVGLGHVQIRGAF